VAISFREEDSRGGPTVLWNANHPVVAAVTEEGVSWCGENIPENDDPTAVAKELLAEQGRAAAWVCKLVRGWRTELWQALVERDVEFPRRITELLIGDPHADLVAWVSQDSRASWYVLSTSG